MLDTIQSALEDLKKGKMIIVVDDENRENEGDIVFLAQYATYENINFLVTHARGLICVPLSEERAEKLELFPMTVRNTDAKGTAFTVSVDSREGITTGISVADRLKTIKDLADNSKCSQDFTRPGHIFPLIAKNGGVLEREGHTEAAVDLARLAGAEEVGVICEILKDDGTMARVPDLKIFAKKHNLKIISIEELITYRKAHEKLVEIATEAMLTTDLGEFKIVGFKNKLDHEEHIALVKGDVSGKRNVLTRIHSECLTGDVFSSMRCECGSQLRLAMEEIDKKGEGVLLYLRQEGRGIGITNKIRAYALQSQGADTLEANLLLGFQGDLRDYASASQMLKALGVHSVELLTNNPLKIQGLEKYGTVISRVKNHETGIQSQNFSYMKTKKEKMGHKLESLK
ncbi:MAG: bifunctional 3,4-dihydroxy-2-butanone-4-phosphate synthase/GTP cyclohydrolase II [Fusobacteriaceae bacterium]